jgi:hypothetical protein
MTILLLCILFALCLALIVWGILETSRVVQFPFLAAVAFLVFIGLPCVPMVSARDLPSYAIARVLGMSILCLSMIWIAQTVPLRSVIIKNTSPRYSEDRLFIASLVLTLCGSFFYYRVNRIYYSDVSIEGGIPSSLLFFAVLLNYGFVFSALRYGRSRQPRYLWILFIGAIFYLIRIVIQARRGMTGEFVLIILCSVWFARRWKLPKYTVILMLAAIPIWLFGIGQYRRVMSGRSGPEVRELTTINLSSGLSSVLETGSTEVTAAAYLMAATAEKRGYEFGLIHWNRLVFNFVPAQWVGSDLKSSLMLKLPNNWQYAYQLYGYGGVYGTTVTGLPDCFSSWWYFGCIKFFIIAYILRWMYVQGMHGSLLWQAVYSYTLVYAVQAITHQTQAFFSALLLSFVVMYIVTVECREGHLFGINLAAMRRRKAIGSRIS